MGDRKDLGVVRRVPCEGGGGGSNYNGDLNKRLGWDRGEKQERREGECRSDPVWNPDRHHSFPEADPPITVSRLRCRSA